jgi:hypothetical protein
LAGIRKAGLSAASGEAGKTSEQGQHGQAGNWVGGHDSPSVKKSPHEQAVREADIAPGPTSSLQEISTPLVFVAAPVLFLAKKKAAPRAALIVKRSAYLAAPIM